MLVIDGAIQKKCLREDANQTASSESGQVCTVCHLTQYKVCLSPLARQLEIKILEIDFAN